MPATLASSRLPLGVPGVYTLPEQPPARLDPQRMDVCAFVGVAPRGPAYQPLVDESHPGGWEIMADLGRPRHRSVAVAIRSFDEYRRLYGGFEGPGLLPYAVASFFEQGGRRAYVVRVVHAQTGAPQPGQPPNLAGMAAGTLENFMSVPLGFFARNAGSWGDTLKVAMGFSTRALGFTPAPGNTLRVLRATDAPPGTLLRLTGAAGQRAFAFCRGTLARPDPLRPLVYYELSFDAALPFEPERIDIVEAWLDVNDTAGNSESYAGLALSPTHPQALASVLSDQSQLIWPHYDWAATELLPASTGVELLRAASRAFEGGQDDYADLVADDFFDASWSPAEELPGEGICALAQSPDATQLLVPDLYVPAQWAGRIEDTETQSSAAGAEFCACVQVETRVTAANVPPSALENLILNPAGGDLMTIAALQNRVVTFCEQTAELIALLDVPPGLTQNRLERWRAQFDSAWAAAYHPWLIASRRAFSLRDDRADTLRPLPPSAVAAGIVAQKEIQFGVQYGPANEIAAEVINLAEPLARARADSLHPQGINCYLREADGIHLTGARTLSRDSQWRQLSVRRLVLMIERTLRRETQWAVFEPNGPKLWDDLRHACENLLRRLFRAGAFAGNSEATSFFVRVRNEPVRLERGELLIEIGVAPAEPIEFIVLQLRRQGDGTLTLEE